MFDQDSPFKRHEELREDTVTKTTKDIYNSQKFVYNLAKHKIPDMRPATKKHFENMGEFLEGYEARMIKHWERFYQTAKEQAKKWETT